MVEILSFPQAARTNGGLHRKLLQVTCCCSPSTTPGRGVLKHSVDLWTQGNTQLQVHFSLFNSPEMPPSSLPYASREFQTFSCSEHLVVPLPECALTSLLTFLTFNLSTFSGLHSPNPLLIYFLMKTWGLRDWSFCIFKANNAGQRLSLAGTEAPMYQPYLTSDSLILM